MKIRALLPPAIIELTDLERYSECHHLYGFPGTLGIGGLFLQNQEATFNNGNEL